MLQYHQLLKSGFYWAFNLEDRPIVVEVDFAFGESYAIFKPGEENWLEGDRIPAEALFLGPLEAPSATGKMADVLDND